MPTSPSRNQSCPCGSGKKLKHCCANRPAVSRNERRAPGTRSAQEYVHTLFDQYADTFEAHLVGKLEYHIPEKICDTLRPMITPDTRLDVLDLGCGTGLMGEALRDACNQLVGVDISPKMAHKAREKGIYTETHTDDLLAYMQRTGSASFDLIVAADVFNYIGKLDAIFSESSRLLKPNGLFAFSVESAVAGESREVVLDKTCRYRHDANYLRRLAVDTRLMEAHFSQVVIRTQSEQPVEGYLCVYSKTSAQ